MHDSRWVCVIGLVGLVAPAFAGELSVRQRMMVGEGRGVYLNHCLACHGPDLRGADAVAAAVPDLSQIAARDGGFKALHVRAHVAEGSHISAGDRRERGLMPRWQVALSHRGGDSDPAAGSTQILALVTYLDWAQQHPDLVGERSR